MYKYLVCVAKKQGKKAKEKKLRVLKDRHRKYFEWKFKHHKIIDEFLILHKTLSQIPTKTKALIYIKITK